MGSDGVGTSTTLWQASHGWLALILLLGLLALWRAGFFRRLLAIVEEMVFSNWRLALLGATAVALSLASGYTTFDGLRNFTSAPLLSVLIAFGIQGVMLIVAWLIGESFAIGMSQPLPRGGNLGAREALIATGLGAALIGLVLYWALTWYGAIGFTERADGALHIRADWGRVADVTLSLLLVLALMALAAFSVRRGGDVLRPYVQSVRLIARNAVLWLMLLASMSASVFFSFDSHFNAIFPAEQRSRAAEIRTLGQVAGILVDTGARAQKVRAAEAERLFASDGWKAYDAMLSRVALAVRGAQAEIAAFLAGKQEERQRAISAQQEHIAGAERSRAALLRKRDELEAELQRLEPSIGALEAELARAQSAYNETQQAIAAKRIDAAAEEGGVEGTLKRGQGPVWRRYSAEIDELQRRLAVADAPRLGEARRRRDLASARIVGLKRELATVAGEVAKYTGAIRTAELRVETAQAADGAADAARIDPDRALSAFESARAAFRRQPDAERLAALQTHCASLAGALSAAPATGEKTRGIDCDPASAAEAAARVFALNVGLLAFHAGCAGGSRLPQAAGTDELLAFGRKCLQDSGLASQDTADLGARLQAIEMNRDDKAHRFVVTWNAVLDGNRLAYLALALAIGVDGLVFVAGLFGAAAARSPLSDLPSPKARSAEQLEAIVTAALGEDRLGNSELVLAAMKPLTGDDHRSEIDLAPYDAERRERIRKVLVAGRSIGAVERAASEGHDERYLVRPELFEFLSLVANSARERDQAYSGRTRLPQIVSVSPKLSRLGNVSQSRPRMLPARRIEAEPPARAMATTPPKRRTVVAGGMSREPDEDNPHWHSWEALMKEVASEAKTAAVALTLQAGEHRDLHAMLKGVERESKRALQKAVRALEFKRADDRQAVPLLNEAQSEILQIVSVLMLLRELDLLDVVIRGAESSGDDVLPNRLRALRDAPEEIDWGTGETWRDVAGQIKQLIDATLTDAEQS
jgi:hypothetical protein